MDDSWPVCPCATSPTRWLGGVRLSCPICVRLYPVWGPLNQPRAQGRRQPAWGSIITVSGSLFCVSACSLSHTRTHTLTRTRSCQVRGVSTCRWPGDAAGTGACVSPGPAATSTCLLPTSRPGPVPSARNHLRLSRGSRGGQPSACSGAATRRGAREDKAALGSGGWHCTEPKAPGFKKVSALRSLPKTGCQRGCFSDEQIGKLRQGRGLSSRRHWRFLLVPSGVETASFSF